MFKRGFTLAEVLITIGIIGVVAALTIPTLTNNYQRRILTTQLQRAYAEISQAGSMAVSEDMSSDFQNSKAFRNGTFVSRYIPKARIVGISDGFATTYKNPPHWGNGEVNINNYAPSTYECAVAKTGYAICFGKNSYNENYGIMDINGKKGPNQMGVDCFRIYFKRNGSLIGYAGELITVLENDWSIDF